MDKERGNTFVKEKPLYSERTREKMFCDDDIFFAIDMCIYIHSGYHERDFLEHQKFSI